MVTISIFIMFCNSKLYDVNNYVQLDCYVVKNQVWFPGKRLSKQLKKTEEYMSRE